MGFDKQRGWWSPEEDFSLSINHYHPQQIQVAEKNPRAPDLEG